MAFANPDLPFPPPREWIGYLNHVFTDGRWIGHGGYGGQFLLADMNSGTVDAFPSVLENDSGYDQSYMLDVIKTLQSVTISNG